MGLEDVRAFQVYLVSQGISWPALNQTVCALRFFYGVTLNRAEIPERIAYARTPRKLPAILSADEVVWFLEAVPSLKARTALTTAYAAGLRASEAVSALPGRPETEVTMNQSNLIALPRPPGRLPPVRPSVSNPGESASAAAPFPSAPLRTSHASQPTLHSHRLAGAADPAAEADDDELLSLGAQLEVCSEATTRRGARLEGVGWARWNDAVVASASLAERIVRTSAHDVAGSCRMTSGGK
jgi:hypothetical protein